MKIRAYSIITILVFFSSLTIGFSQTLGAPSRVELLIEPITPVSAVDATVGVNPFAGDTVNVTLMIELPQQTGIAKLHVKTGSTLGGTDYAHKAFVFDVSGPLGDGTTYKRSGKAVYLCLGKVYDIDEVYAEVSLEATGGAVTSTTTTSFIP